MIDERVLKKNGLHLTDDGTQISTDNFSKYSSIFLGIDIYNNVHSWNSEKNILDQLRLSLHILMHKLKKLVIICYPMHVIKFLKNLNGVIVPLKQQTAFLLCLTENTNNITSLNNNPSPT